MKTDQVSNLFPNASRNLKFLVLYLQHFSNFVIAPNFKITFKDEVGGGKAEGKKRVASDC